MRKLRAFLLFAAIATFTFLAYGQSTFENLDFEAANISSSQSPGLVNAEAALPGWTVVYGTNGPQTQVGYNLGAVFLVAGPLASLIGTNTGGISSINGNFSVLLQGGEVVTIPGPMPFVPETFMYQSGYVPANAQSITFEAQPGTATLLLSINGENVPFNALSTGANYTLYGGNISVFAGQVSELEFTVGLYGTGWNLDSIEFSPQPTPEPSSLTLFGIGVGLLAAIRFSSIARL
jgi:hypothetical protein